MAKGHSIDLRERVVRTLDEGLSKRAAHQLFHISRSTIDHWLALREQTGSLAPRPMRRTRSCQLEGAVFQEFAVRHAHSTLGEMAVAWHEENGVNLSAMSFSRALCRLGWTRKKRAGVTRSVIATRSATKRRERSS